MRRDEILLADIRRMDAELASLIGRTAFGHVANPTPTTQRIAFGDGTVCLSMAEAHSYMTALLATARRNPAELPWPLSEPIERRGDR